MVIFCPRVGPGGRLSRLSRQVSRESEATMQASEVNGREQASAMSGANWATDSNSDVAVQSRR